MGTRSVWGALAGEEAERKPGARQNRVLAWVCHRRIYYFFRIRKEEAFTQETGIYLLCAWDLATDQSKSVTRPG